MTTIFVPWLAFDGLEIGNGTRVSAYLEHVGIPGTLDIRPECDCLAVSEGPYRNPELDEAPWVEPTWPHSVEFLGFYPDSIDIPPAVSRRVAQRATGGANLGPTVLGGRVAVVSGLMFAISELGMSWGERWLSEALHQGCDACDLGELCVLPACPPEGLAETVEDSYFRRLLDVGLVDGPVYVREIDQRCHVQRASFVLQSRHGHLFGEQVLEGSGVLAALGS